MANQPHPPSPTLDSQKASGPGLVLSQMACQWTGSPDATVLCLLFTQHIRYGFTLPWCWYQLGMCLCAPLSGSVRAHAQTSLRVRLCGFSHAIPLPRLKHSTLMSLSDENFIPTPPPSSSYMHCKYHIHIYIGVWHRYRSKTVARDLSLSLKYVVIKKTTIRSTRESGDSLWAQVILSSLYVNKMHFRQWAHPEDSDKIRFPAFQVYSTTTTQVKFRSLRLCWRK